MVTELQRRIGAELHVRPEVDPPQRCRKLIGLLKDYLLDSGQNGYVLGISGGQDSTLCGRLAQLAVEELNAGTDAGPEAGTRLYQFWAVRLPYGVQRDEEDALLALSFMRPSHCATFDIRPAVDVAAKTFAEVMGEPMTDFVKGNLKARERMEVQYALAGQKGLLVLGTDHAAEAVTGFYTKFGDGAADVTPLTGLTKRQGRTLLIHLGAPERLYRKVPTADLEDAKPLLPDETALGLTYDDIDDYLEQKDVAPDVAQRLEHYYVGTRHKRAAPITPFDAWWKERF